MRRSLLVLPLLAAGLAVFTLAAHPGSPSQFQPGSVSGGEQVLRSKGCLDCHSLKGTGGKRAPDFAALSDDADTPARLATALWNHSPRMWTEYEAAGRSIPTLSQNDVADLFSYFFATLYFEPHGNPERGRSVFVEKSCAGCHSEVLNAEALNPFLSRWTQLRDPVSWAERFWNHASEMDSATALRGVKWPELSERDTADLMVFLSSLPGAPPDGPAFSVGEPLIGQKVYERSCESCHSLGQGDRSKVDLLKRSRPSSVAGYISAMWNHAPKMRRRGGVTSKLAPGEMQDVVGFLFLQRYFYEEGDAGRGRQVYDSKRCAGCHEGSRVTGAPDLAGKVEAYTPITMTVTAWRHGASMGETIRRQGGTWPQFQRSEMADLLAFLNSRLRPQIARP